MLGTSFEGRFLLITYNTTQDLEEEWMPIGNEIIASVAITE